MLPARSGRVSRAHAVVREAVSGQDGLNKNMELWLNASDYCTPLLFGDRCVATVWVAKLLRGKDI